MRARRAIAVLALALAVISVSACGAGTSRTQAAHRVALGAYIPGVAWAPNRISGYARTVGQDPAIVSEYRQWNDAAFLPHHLNGVWRRGAMPMITWEPFSYEGHRYSLRAIARGRFDGYLRRSARSVRSFGHPVMVRFAHEMNGGWYPWGVKAEGNTARVYKRAWRHVVRTFRREGADNVLWIWCPNVNQSGNIPFAGQYPGDAWVDWVGLDGFNWGYGGSSYSFREIFGRSYRVLRRISSKPMMVAETGTQRRGKAHWIKQALNRQLPNFGRIKALVWFNEWANGVDLRFDAPYSALQAFRSAASGGRYDTNRTHLLEVSDRR